MTNHAQVNLQEFFTEQLLDAKTKFERALDCKHTEFDDLYPYMNEQPQFFWYKRYVAWSELLTVVKLAEMLGIDWQPLFTARQAEFIRGKVLQGKVLDHWYPEEDSQQEESLSRMEE